MQAFTGRRNPISSLSNAPDDPVQPLRTMADRVGAEVEEFAQRVDIWHSHLDKSNPKARYHSTIRVVSRFKAYADATVQTLKKRSQEENQADFAKSVRRRVKNLADIPHRSVEDESGDYDESESGIASRAKPSLSPVQELRQWQAEAATWDLLRIIIELYHPEPGADTEASRRKELADTGDIHRYSPERAIWDRFIVEDDRAKEKLLILKWLEKTADGTESSIQSIVEQLEEESGKPAGSWSAGWLDTKLEIKYAKRIGGVGQPLGDDVPALRSKDKSSLLVSQLDPDAPMRQGRSLEKSDDLYERGQWMILYEMLRRGRPWKEVAEWCRDHNEAWRAVSLGFSGDEQEEARTNLSSHSVGFLWRRMCFLHARGAPLEYEAAVFGLLGGDVKTVETISRTWDDFLYARYNALLLSKFDAYLQEKYPDRLPQAAIQKFASIGVEGLGGWENANELAVERLRKLKVTAAQARLPMKLIQGSLIGQTFYDLVYNLGVAISEVTVKDTRPSKLVISSERDHTERCYSELALDPHALRIIVHILLTLRGGFDVMQASAESADEVLIENVTASYIELLRLKRRFPLIPTYAAQLSKNRQIFVLSRILPDIRDANEQKNFLKEMQSHKIEVVDVITEYYGTVLRESSISDEKAHIPRYEIIERVDEEGIWPGYRINADFLELSTGSEEEALIDALQWFTHLEADRTATFMALTEVTKHFLLNGRVGAVIRVASEMSLEAISLLKTKAYCGYSFDFSQEGAEELDKQALVRDIKSMPSNKRLAYEPTEETHQLQVEEFRAISQTYNELVNLAHALELLHDYREEELRLIALQAEEKKGSTKKLRSIFDAIDATLDFLLTDFLTIGEDEAQMQQFTWIREAYIPEIVLAYNACIQSCGQICSRDILTKSGDLANTIASDAAKPVQDAFLNKNRMEELVQALAATAQATLRMREQDGKRGATKRPRGSRGETTKIWG